MSSDPVGVFLAEGLGIEDHIIVAKRLIKKRKTPSDLSDVGVQTGTIEGPTAVREVFVLPNPHHGLDVPRERGIPHPFSSRVSLLMNQKYGRKVAQSIILFFYR